MQVDEVVHSDGELSVGQHHLRQFDGEAGQRELGKSVAQDVHARPLAPFGQCVVDEVVAFLLAAVGCSLHVVVTLDCQLAAFAQVGVFHHKRVQLLYVWRLSHLLLRVALLLEQHQSRDAGGRPVALPQVEVVDELYVAHLHAHHVEQVVVEDSAIGPDGHGGLVATCGSGGQHVGMLQGTLGVVGCHAPVLLWNKVVGIVAVEHAVQDGVHRYVLACLPLGHQPVDVHRQGVGRDGASRVDAQQLGFEQLAIVVGRFCLDNDLVEDAHLLFGQVLVLGILKLFPKCGVADGFRVDTEYRHCQ